MNNAIMKSDYDMTEKEFRKKLIGKTAIIQEGVEIKINFLKIEYDPDIPRDNKSLRTMIKISTNGYGWYRIYPCTKIISEKHVYNDEEFRKRLMKKPTEIGKLNYEPDGYFDDEFPCTCNINCPLACKGGCGCMACTTAYGDFLSLE